MHLTQRMMGKPQQVKSDIQQRAKRECTYGTREPLQLPYSIERLEDGVSGVDTEVFYKQQEVQEG